MVKRQDNNLFVILLLYYNINIALYEVKQYGRYRIKNKV